MEPFRDPAENLPENWRWQLCCNTCLCAYSSIASNNGPPNFTRVLGVRRAVAGMHDGRWGLPCSHRDAFLPSCREPTGFVSRKELLPDQAYFGGRRIRRHGCGLGPLCGCGLAWAAASRTAASRGVSPTSFRPFGRLVPAGRAPVEPRSSPRLTLPVRAQVVPGAERVRRPEFVSSSRWEVLRDSSCRKREEGFVPMVRRCGLSRRRRSHRRPVLPRGGGIGSVVLSRMETTVPSGFPRLVRSGPARPGAARCRR
jgi:hypothetical protein